MKEELYLKIRRPSLRYDYPQAEQKAKRRALPHSVTLCVFYGRCLFQLFYAPIAAHQGS